MFFKNKIPCIYNQEGESCVSTKSSIFKNKTFIIVGIIFLVSISVVIAYYHLNADIFDVEKQINKIGSVTLESESLINIAESSYKNLSPSKQSRVKNKNHLDESKRQYLDLVVASFDESELYNQIKEDVFSTYVSSYFNTNVSFNKQKRCVNIKLTLPEGVTYVLMYNPTLAKSTWNQVEKKCSEDIKPLYAKTAKYQIDVLLQVFGEGSSSYTLLEMLNGETTFNILD